MKPQIIFFDIDGTLVSFKTHCVPASAKSAIISLRRKGIKVVIATGRVLREMNNLGDLEFDGYITANGACCVDAKRNIIAQYPLSKETLGKLALHLKERPFPCTFATNEGNFINVVDEQVLMITQLVDLPVPPVKSVSEIIEQDVLQLSAFIDPEREAELLNHVLTDCVSSRWHSSFTDFNVKHCNKATGMDTFLAYFDKERKYSMAFGDGGNDISMLKHAATGIAMDNAGDEVKKVADYVTGSVDEDGIVNALRYFNLL